MCGIAGIYNFNEALIHTDELEKMTNAIIHRGPDGEGHWINKKGNLGFGHRRLSIIDLSDNAKQPMHYAAGRYTITFNGEIYNYLELKKYLVTKGYDFQSNSDTEVLLALFDLKKEKCLADLDGMFAFALWDEQEQTLFCARDRFGEKPFYYHYEPDKHFYFASEMKALRALGVPKENDKGMLLIYLKTGNVFDENDLSRTFYSKIKQLDGSHHLVIRKGIKPIITKYYTLDNIQVNENISKEEASIRFYDLLSNSIKLRLRSDVPVGSSLSGGLDSSSIVMLIDKIKGDVANQNTFSARFLNYDKDEGKHIHEVLKSCKNITGYEVWPSGESMQEDFERLIHHQEEPFGSASIYAQWKVMELAKKHNTVVLLDGQGADEYLGGYLSYYRIYLFQLYYTNFKLYEKERKNYNELRKTDFKRIEDTETFRMKAGRLKRKILKQPMPYGKDSLRDQFKKDMLVSGLKELVRYADRNSMAHSREVRLPFLCHHLVEFAFSLPAEFKLYMGWTKWVLREAMKDTLPPSITWRIDKIGYEPPQIAWLTSPEFKRKIEEGKKIALDNSVQGEFTAPDDWQCLMLSNYFYN